MKNESDSSPDSPASVILDRVQLEAEKSKEIPKERSLAKVVEVDKPFDETSGNSTSDSTQSNDVSSSSSDGNKTNRINESILSWGKRWSIVGLPMLLLGILLGSSYERHIGVSKGASVEVRAEANCGPEVASYVAQTVPSRYSYHCHSHK